MTENKKVKNAQSKVYNGIKFKSLSEIMVYKTLIDEGFKPAYEQNTYTIWEGLTPTIPFYTKNKYKKRNKNIHILSDSTVKDTRKLTNITYTPDFVFTYKDKFIFVEVKGFSNDLFPYKFKMFRKLLESYADHDKYEIWEVFTKKQLMDCIKNLKNNENS